MWQARVNSIKPLFEGETPCIVSLYHLFNSRCLCQWNRKKNVILIQTFTCEYLFFFTVVFSSRSKNWSRKERNRYRSCWKGGHLIYLTPCFWWILWPFLQLCIDIFYQVWEKIAPGLDSQFDAPYSLPLIAPRPLLLLNGKSNIFAQFFSIDQYMFHKQ